MKEDKRIYSREKRFLKSSLSVNNSTLWKMVTNKYCHVSTVPCSPMNKSLISKYMKATSR
jgi:hypothetical protein